jgi:topoisomerase-4 subunit B
VHDIAVAIGVDPGSDDLSRLRFGKVCILADADSDGAHIATLLCALFCGISRAGGGGARLCRDAAAVSHRRRQAGLLCPRRRRAPGRPGPHRAEKLKGKVSVQRFKGLGEMNPSQLRETTIHPDTRRLVQLTLNPATRAVECLATSLVAGGTGGG